MSWRSTPVVSMLWRPYGKSKGGRAGTQPSPSQEGSRRRTAISSGDSLASVTKLATAVAVLVAAEEGIVDLDEPAGPPGSTVRHLLAHASGLPLDGDVPVARPGTKRIYSNTGFEVLAALCRRTRRDAVRRVLRGGLGLPARRLAGARDRGTARAAARGRARAARADRIARETLDEATSVQFPGLDGVLPGFGRMEPNDWGLGFELRDGKSPHWTGERNSPRTFGR